MRSDQGGAEIFNQRNGRSVAVNAILRPLLRVHSAKKNVENAAEMAFVAVAAQPQAQILVQGDGIDMVLLNIHLIAHGGVQSTSMVVSEPVAKKVRLPVDDVETVPELEHQVDKAFHKPLNG